MSINRPVEIGFTHLEVTRVTPPFAWSLGITEDPIPSQMQCFWLFLSCLRPATLHKHHSTLVVSLLHLLSGRNDLASWNLSDTGSSADERGWGGRNLLVPLATKSSGGKKEFSSYKSDCKLKAVFEWVRKEWASHSGQWAPAFWGGPGTWNTRGSFKP